MTGIVVLVVGFVLGYCAKWIDSLIKGFLAGRRHAKSGRLDAGDGENFRKIAKYFMSDKPVAPRVRVALQALVDRIDEPVPRDGTPEEVDKP